jgi:hypothetical protein
MTNMQRYGTAAVAGMEATLFANSVMQAIQGQQSWMMVMMDAMFLTTGAAGGAAAFDVGLAGFRGISARLGSAGSRSATRTGVWDLNPLDRGNVIEIMLGGNTVHPFPVVDKWVDATGTATSIKSIDLTAPSYTDRPSKIYSTLKGYIDKLVAFDGKEMGGTEILAHEIQSRVLQVAIPPGSALADQATQLNRARDYAAKNGIVFDVVEIH